MQYFRLKTHHTAPQRPNPSSNESTYCNYDKLLSEPRTHIDYAKDENTNKQYELVSQHRARCQLIINQQLFDLSEQTRGH